MYRILFEWRGVRVWSYPALVYLGLIVGIAVQGWSAHRAGLDAGRVYAATLLLLPVTLTGARLLHVALHWPAYRREPRRIWRRSEGGAAILGGIPAMLLASIPVLAFLGLPAGSYWDVTLSCILVAMAFGRVGCLLNGCCAGRASDAPIALRLPDRNGVWTRRIPVQLLEGGVALALLLAAVRVGSRPDRPGALFLGVLAAYGCARCVLQAYRAERVRIAGLDPQLVLSLSLVLSSLTALALLG